MWEGSVQRNLSTVFKKAFTTCLLVCSLKLFFKAGTVAVPASPAEKLRLREEAEVSDCGRQCSWWQFISFHACLLTACHELGSWDLPFSVYVIVFDPHKPCQIDKVLQMRKRAQGKVTCPGTHSSWMVGLGSNPQSSDFSSLGNDSTTPGWLSPHPTCSALIVTNHTSTSPGFAKPLWIKGICPLLSLTKKVLIYVAGSDCVCVCRFYMRVEFFILNNPHNSTMKDILSLMWFTDEKSEALEDSLIGLLSQQENFLTSNSSALSIGYSSSFFCFLIIIWL